jgi:hypothetical protein
MLVVGHHDAASQAEYASLPTEMKSVANELGAKVLREVTWDQIFNKIPEIRKKLVIGLFLELFIFRETINGLLIR